MSSNKFTMSSNNFTMSSNTNAPGPARAHDSQPSEYSDSYFPSGPTSGSTSGSSSRTSSPVGSGSGADTTTNPWSAGLPLNSPIGNYGPLPALAREFPKPPGDLDVAAQLAKKPLRWSLHSSLKLAAAGSERFKAQQADCAETRARKLEEAKREWMSWRA